MSLPSGNDIKIFLAKSGWRVTRVGEHSDIWTSRDGDQVVFPKREEYPDHELRVRELLDDLSTIVSPRRDIVFAIEEASHSTLYLRDDRRSAYGETSLAEGQAMLALARQVWLDSAWETARRSRKSKRDDVQRFMSQLKVGQTEVGSFVLRVMAPSPVHHEVPQTEAFDAYHFELSVADRAGRVLRALADAVDEAIENDLRPVASEAAFFRAASEGVTRTMCRTVLSATTDPGTDALEARVRLAIPLADRADTLVRFDGSHTGALQLGIRALSGADTPRIVTVEGWVVDLHRPPDAEHGEVIVLSLFGDGRSARQVRIVLDEASYDTAVRAHRSRSVVRCSGVIDRLGRRSFHLLEPSGFGLVSDSQQPLELDEPGSGDR